jgi:FkbM family methyltransferase
MQADPALKKGRIAVLPFAVTDHDGREEFFMVSSGHIDWRGISSLYRRVNQPETPVTTLVATTRLDSALAGRLPVDARLGLWIDAEGKGYEVIDGAAAVLDKVQLVHIEVETVPCIGAQQRLYPDVKARLHAAGLVEMAVDRAPDATQLNALFVRRGLPAAMHCTTRYVMTLARLRRGLGRILRCLCPCCMRWYHRRRL